MTDDKLCESELDAQQAWKRSPWPYSPATNAHRYSSVPCGCHVCQPIELIGTHMIVCPSCGNKRCPRATYHGNTCSGSNDIGQHGSVYGDMTQDKLNRLRAPPTLTSTHRYSACKSGPCNGGTKLCPSPEACGCAETDDRIARVGVGVVLIVVAVLMAGAIVTTALILSGAWL